MSSDYGYNMSTPGRVPSPNYDAKVSETYNNGNGFTPLATNTRGSNLFQNNSTSNARRPDYANGGPAAGRSCLVVPTFGSGKKKKKKEKKSTSPVNSSTPKKHGSGGFFGRNVSSTESVSTSAESSMPDPYQVYYSSHAEKQSLLKSFSKKQSGGNRDARDWYLETMVEEDETADQETNHKKINISNQPLQFGNRPPQSQIPQQNQHCFLFAIHAITKANQQSKPTFPYLRFWVNDALQQYFKSSPAASSEDRGHDARRNQSRMHAYDGEMEPEGVRGQEAKAVTSNNNNNAAPIIYDGPGSSPYFSANRTPLTPVMRDFAASNVSENSSQLLPIHQVVNDRQRNVMRIANPEPPSPKASPIQAKYSPGYNERMNVASNVLNGGRLPPRQAQSDYSGFEDDIEHEEMISNNRAEFEQEFREQAENRQALQRLHLQQQQEQLKQINEKIFEEKAMGSPNAKSQNESTMSDDLRSFDTPSRTSRKSAPVNIDDASFENPLEHIQGIHSMAMEHVTKGEFDLALQAFQEVLKVYLKEHGPAHPLTASAHHNLGTVHTKRAGLLPEHTLHQRHCREQALQCFQAAARSARDCPTLGPNHPNVAVSLVRIGFLLLQARQYKNAVITFAEALRIRTENYGLYHGLVANLFNNLGVCHMHLQQFSEGRKQLQKALDIQKELLVQEGEDSSTALLELADTLCNIGGLNLEWIRRQGPDARRAFDAEAAFVEAQKLRTKVLGEDHALTNQVRSLHDMVRSLPVPTAVDKATPPKPTSRSPVRAPPSWASASTNSAKQQNTNMANFSPVAISDMTNSVGGRTASSKHSARSMAESLDESAAMNDTSGLSIPALKNHDAASKRSGNSKNANEPKQHFMDRYDATEESWVLRKPADDETSSAANLVTYARSTVSMGSESNHESDRAATMRQAKEMLDAHQDFMYSPNSNPNQRMPGKQTERTVEERDGNAYEDGLVPLAGDWPGPRDTNRLSPICLQNPTRNLHTIHNCAVSYMLRGRYTEAVALLEMVVECQKQKYGVMHANVGSAVHNVGIAYLGGEIHYKAFQAFEEAVRIRKAALGRNHPVVAVSLVKFGISLMLLQRHEDSLWIFRDALAIRKEALGDLHPSNARIYNNIGCVHVELEELEEARKAFEAALNIQRNALIQNSENGPMIFGASTTLQNLGYLYGKRELYEKAAMVLRESLSLQERIMPPEHPTVLITLESLAETCLDARRFTHALKYYRELFDRSQTMEPLDCMKQATTLQTMASIHGKLNDPSAQKKKLEMAIKFVRSSSIEDPIERRALEDRLLGEIEVVQGNILSSQDRQKWV
eukprot:CAMPEP_0116128876 /NCGR_PEP_ID=MMETSP0329-20121206/7621_1 /TAXON_ID=697910 /ORGANISM="Pseudo-nitzschia arenysensis, Strain B593" /LENGTH=1317 /DNA_ID=CAMNT_0003623099 /DNA_START=132 /DNA_END=4087 /DNA_ORIENTATION=-